MRCSTSVRKQAGTNGTPSQVSVVGRPCKFLLIPRADLSGSARLAAAAIVDACRSLLIQLPGAEMEPSARRRPPAAASRGEPDPHPLPDSALIHARADSVDHPSAIMVRNLEAVDGARSGPGTGLVVRRIDRRDVHLDPDLPGSRLGPIYLRDPQHLGGGAVMVVDGGFHASWSF